MKRFFIPLVAAASLLASSSLCEGQKALLKSNGELLYCQDPIEVESVDEIFRKGSFYGRLRSNNFLYRWEREDDLHDDHVVAGIGASVIFDSARYEGFALRLGLYGSKAFFDSENDPVSRLKAGKDLFSRYDYVNTGSRSMGVVGQAYLGYSGMEGSEVRLGRQLVETFYTRSNDTKMIPNTFDGVTLHLNGDIKGVFGYLAKQKLRDHTSAHSVLAYGDGSCDAHLYPQWSQNDDSAMHRGLTCSALMAAGKPTDAPLIVADLRARPTGDLKAGAAFYTVPQLLSQAMGELDYTFRFDGFTLTPGLRYIRQFDNGAGAVGGASYTTDTTSYSDPNSLDGGMIGARVVAKTALYRLNLAYTQVFDEADLITPWRGFPTSGYTRSMGIYNWRANTKSYRIELVRNYGGNGLYIDPFVQLSILYIDADDKKSGFHMSDEIYYYAGVVRNLPQLPSLQWRARVGYAHILDEGGNDSIDGRFELNYLF